MPSLKKGDYSVTWLPSEEVIDKTVWPLVAFIGEHTDMQTVHSCSGRPKDHKGGPNQYGKFNRKKHAGTMYVDILEKKDG